MHGIFFSFPRETEKKRKKASEWIERSTEKHLTPWHPGSNMEQHRSSERDNLFCKTKRPLLSLTSRRGRIYFFFSQEKRVGVYNGSQHLLWLRTPKIFSTVHSPIPAGVTESTKFAISCAFLLSRLITKFWPFSISQRITATFETGPSLLPQNNSLVSVLHCGVNNSKSSFSVSKKR